MDKHRWAGTLLAWLCMAEMWLGLPSRQLPLECSWRPTAPRALPCHDQPATLHIQYGSVNIPSAPQDLGWKGGLALQLMTPTRELGSQEAGGAASGQSNRTSGLTSAQRQAL